MIIKHEICGHKVTIEQVDDVWFGTFDDFPNEQFIENTKLDLTKDMFAAVKKLYKQ